PQATLRVANTGDRPIQVGSHTHLFEVNRALRFDGRRAYGCRLDVPAGTSLRFEPGETRDVVVVPLKGSRTVFGMSALVNGTLDGREADAVRQMRARGFEDSA
ncbi:MAG: urease subunit beta, partial [Acidobacteria bacterium]|nr:urease subunit beta [Acidobacteriota bacterium]